MERLSMHSRGPDFFLSGLGNFGRDFSIFLVPIMFAICPLSFQWVPEHVPNSTSFYPMYVFENAALLSLIRCMKGEELSQTSKYNLLL